MLGVLFVQWYRSDEREARRFDRREGDVESERVAYNAYLAQLDARARQAEAGEASPPVGYTRRAPRDR